MSFLSYRTRIPRHFDSHANVRSTTHRRGLWPCDRSQPFFLLADPADVRGVSGCGRRPFPRWVVVRLVQGHVLRLILCRFGPLDHDRLDRRLQELLFDTFAPAITTPSGPPSPSVSRLFLVPFFPRSVGFLPVFFPPEPGLAQHRVGRLPLPLHPAEFVTLGDQDRPDSSRRCRCTQRWNQSWTVLLGPNRSGSWSHWQPLRIRKMIALSIFRQLATFRPVGFLGQNSVRIGSIRRHNSSGISQIVPSGLREAFGGPWLSLLSLCPEVVTACYKLLPAKGVPPVLG